MKAIVYKCLKGQNQILTKSQNKLYTSKLKKYNPIWILHGIVLTIISHKKIQSNLDSTWNYLDNYKS